MGASGIAANGDVSILLVKGTFLLCRDKCRNKFDMSYSVCYDPLPRWSMGKFATPFFTGVPAEEYVEVYL